MAPVARVMEAVRTAALVPKVGGAEATACMVALAARVERMEAGEAVLLAIVEACMFRAACHHSWSLAFGRCSCTVTNR